MSLKNLWSVVLALVLSPSAVAGSDFFIEVCSLGCPSGAGGAQISCVVATIFPHFDLAFVFSEDIDLATVNGQSFQIINPANSSVPQGTIFLDPNNPRRLLFRPLPMIDAQGITTYSLETNTTYLLRIPGTAQGDPGPFIRSTSGVPNLSRLECVFTVVPPLDLFTDVCNGDGGDQQGCTGCPCGNNAAPGTIGGCLNSASTSGRLIAAGQNSVSPGALVFEARELPPTAVAILTSGSALAPTNMANPCFGLDSGARSIHFDGLRCAVQGVRRHDLRVSDASGAIGLTTEGWGTQPISNFPPLMSGQTRHFQVVYRDSVGVLCASGLNTTQAISILFVT